VTVAGLLVIAGATLPLPRQQAYRLSVAGGVAFLALQSGTAILLRPWVPSEALRGEWVRTLPGRAPFGGKVASAAISGSVVSDGSTLRDSLLDARLREGRIDLKLDLISGLYHPEGAPVFELLGRHGPVLAVAALGRDLTFQPPARSYALRLRRPAIRLPRALPASPGARLELVAGEQRGHPVGGLVGSRGAPGETAATQPPPGLEPVYPVRLCVRS
jgi:hypothetical protein